MPGLRILLIILVVLMVAGAWALLRSKRRRGPMVVQPRTLPAMKGSLDAPARRVDVALGREILHLLEAGRREEAVALVRERTGWGAQEADEAVARLDRLRKRLES
ncbi:MAG TPA: hypothetical protein VF591_10550 [Pyrinomonadaceae bacterium]